MRRVGLDKVPLTKRSFPKINGRSNERQKLLILNCKLNGLAVFEKKLTVENENEKEGILKTATFG